MAGFARTAVSSAVQQLGDHMISHRICPERNKKLPKKRRRKSELTRPHRVRKHNRDLCKCRTSNRPVGGDNVEHRSSREFSTPLIISCVPTVPGESRESLIKNRRQTNDYKAVAVRPLNDCVDSLLRRRCYYAIFPRGPTTEHPIHRQCVQDVLVTTAIHCSPAKPTRLHPAFRQRGIFCGTRSPSNAGNRS